MRRRLYRRRNRRTDTAELDADGRQRIFNELTVLFKRVIERFPSLRGFLLSGGETAGRLLAGLGVRTAPHMQSEIMPLISLSRIVDGGLRGRYLVTKGGSVGTTSTIADALARLYDALTEDAPLPLARGRVSLPAKWLMVG